MSECVEMAKAVSLAEVARQAGVSKSTASIVLSRGDRFERISEPCVQRVEQAARSLGYVPHYAMSAMRRGRSDAIAMPVEAYFADMLQRRSGRMHTGYFDEIWSGIRVAAQSEGFSPMQVLPLPGRRAIEHAIHALRGRRVDGLVIPAALEMVEAERVEKKVTGLPTVMVDAREDSVIPSIYFDTTGGIELILEHLKGLGHRDVLWFGPTFHRKGMVDRERVFVTSAWDRGMRGQSCRCEPTADVAEDLLTKARASLTEYIQQVDSSLPFTAVVCFSDMFAIGAMQALHGMGIGVPDQVSVVGFDNIQAPFTSPALTTVDHRLHDMGQRATELLIEMIEGGGEAIRDRAGYVETIEPRLVVRDSTARATTKDA
jgi:DNA-binding LacI/PurR family transcriptional regulator